MQKNSEHKEWIKHMGNPPRRPGVNHDGGNCFGDIVSMVSKQTGIGKKRTTKILKAMLDVVKGALLQGAHVSLLPLGKFAIIDHRRENVMALRFLACNWLYDWCFDGSGWRNFTEIDEDGNETVKRFINEPKALRRGLFDFENEITAKAIIQKPTDYDDWQQSRTADNSISSCSDSRDREPEKQTKRKRGRPKKSN